VHTFKFLGAHLTDDLSWSANTSETVKKAQQRLHFLSTQEKQQCNLLVAFYRTTIESVLKDSSHPGHHLFTLLPSGRRYRSFRARTTRLKNSFFPTAIRTLNTDMH